MSARKLQAVPPTPLKKKLPPPPPEDDEEDEELDEDMDMDDDDMDMGVDILTSLLATEEGDTLATTLVNLNDAVERIATSLELQNKIMVKMLAALRTSGCGCACAKPEPEPTIADETPDATA
jgi:hypothetical protein